MSVGFTHIVPDGVVLVADGARTRMVHPPGGGPPRRLSQIRDVDKVSQYSPSAFAIPIGVSQINDPALDCLSAQPVSARAEDIESAFYSCLEAGWKDAEKQFSARGVDIATAHVAGSFLIAGVDAVGPFLKAVGRNAKGREGPIDAREVGATQTLGGSGKARSSFRLAPPEWESDVGPVNAVVKHVIESAVVAIRAEEAEDDRVGGVCRFAVVRNGFPTIKDLVSNLSHYAA